MTRYIPKLPPLDPCPVEYVFVVIGGRWKSRILHRLGFGPTSLSELRRSMPRAREAVLVQQLKAMAEAGIVERLPRENGRAWGDFVLTERGRKLLQALASISEWGLEEIKQWSPSYANAKDANASPLKGQADLSAVD